MVKITFPDCVVKGEIPLEMSERDAVAYALLAWSCCSLGKKPPEEFGKFMVAFYKRFKYTPTSENLMKRVDEIKSHDGI